MATVLQLLLLLAAPPAYGKAVVVPRTHADAAPSSPLPAAEVSVILCA